VFFYAKILLYNLNKTFTILLKSEMVVDFLRSVADQEAKPSNSRASCLKFAAKKYVVPALAGPGVPLAVNFVQPRIPRS